jgi:type I restriction enzyme S subunit
MSMPLKEALTFQRGFDITRDVQRPGPYFVYSSSGPKSTHSEYKVKGPGVVIGRKGSLGTVFFSDQDFWPHDTTLWVKDFHGNDPKFAYYYLKTMGLERFDAGASNPSLNRNHIHTINVMWPESLAMQQEISKILTTYDDFIENAIKRISNLEAIARSFYIDTIRDKASDVKLMLLSECPYWRMISENISTYEGKKIYYATADIENLETTGIGVQYRHSDRPSRAQKQPLKYSVWFARMIDTYKIAWYSEINSNEANGSILSSGFCGFEALDSELWPLLFLLISSKEFHAKKDMFSTGATQISLTNSGLNRIEMPIPNEIGARNLGRATKPILDQILILQKIIKNLGNTRDLLLTRLMSGQIKLEISHR